MSDTPGSLSRNPESAADDLAARLSALWRQGQAPDLKDLLADARQLSAAELTDVLCADQRERWLHGQRPEIETYLALHRSFHPGAEPAIDLVFGEFLARRELGEVPNLEDYCRRFPNLAGQLRLHVGLYDALGDADLASASEQDTRHAVQTPAAAGGRPGVAASRGRDAKVFESDYESFKRLLQEIDQERSAGTLLQMIVRRLAERPHVALARIWLVRPGDLCATCPARPECPDQTTCLHLVASAGCSLGAEGNWARIDGRNRRVPLGVRKVGLIAASGRPIEVAHLEPDAPWLASPEWAKREGIRGFGGQPMVHDGHVVGVLAVFFRTPVVGAILMWLRLIADRIATAVAAEGGRRAEAGTRQAASLSPPFPFSPVVYPDLPGYEILGEAGRGGMGIVYKARQLSLQRLVAIKVVPFAGAGQPQVIARFHQERLLVARLAHPNLVATHDAGGVAGLPYFVMEYVEGTGLDALVRQQGPLPVAEACEVIRQAALGLQHIHEHGLVHRDVKPSNLMLTSSGLVKVLDLGLARIVNESGQVEQITSSGQFLGTLDYMAPEQCDNSHAVDIRADIYGLGCTFYHLLAGAPPFAAFSSPYQKLKAQAETPVPSVRERRPDVPQPLAAILERMLAKDRESRFSTPAEVVTALASFASGAHLSELFPRVKEEGGRTIRESRSHPSSVLLHPSQRPVRVGIIHSLSGTTLNSEAPVVDATLLAIEEINQRGGIRGRKVEALVRDGQSDALTFARQAERLITQDRVCTLFGCWLSACRKQVLPVVEKHNHLLLYPKTHEGLEQSPCIVYLGAAPNQFILPAVRWAVTSLRKRRFFLVGLDQVYARAANAIIRDEVTALGGAIVGEEYLLITSTEVADAVHRITESGADMILNTLAGDRNVPFARALRAAGVTADRLPTIHFSASEIELRGLSARETAGDYAAWTYFQNLDRPENLAFVQRFQARYGQQRVTADPMEAAYVGVHLWAQAVEAADSDDPQAIRHALRGQSFRGPGGVVRIDPENQHAWKVFRLGKIVEDGQFEVIASSAEPIRPEPYAASRSPAAWHAFLADLHQRWDGLWANPGR